MIVQMNGDLKIKCDEAIDTAYQRGYEDGKKAVEEQAEKITYTDIDEAYQRGYRDGRKDIIKQSDFSYQCGLKDAWKCGKRIASETSFVLSKMFGEVSPSAVFQQYSPQVAMQKIKEYEEQQIEEWVQKHDTKPVKLHINKVSKHISNIDLDEERQPEKEMTNEIAIEVLQELKNSHDLYTKLNDAERCAFNMAISALEQMRGVQDDL